MPTPSLGTPLSSLAVTTYYVDCAAPANGTGSSSSPWNALAAVNTHVPFGAGDSILFRRGVACIGSLAPQGSGASGAPIRLGDYGTGSLPAIQAGSGSAQALLLNNQSHWTVQNLDFSGGTLYGVLVTGSKRLTSFQLINLAVHDTTSPNTYTANAGQVIFRNNFGFDDVILDNVSAYNGANDGIIVGPFDDNNTRVGDTRSTNVTVRNSSVSNLTTSYSDGITFLSVDNGLSEYNVVHDSGSAGLWNSNCHTCTVQYSEAYNIDTQAGADGAAFDEDYLNEDNIFQYNYGHDTGGPCVSFYGAGASATTSGPSRRNTFRYNVCAHNARNASLDHQGYIFISTWNGGSIDGVKIYNNTFYNAPLSPTLRLIQDNAAWSGSEPSFFKNNIIYSAVPFDLNPNGRMTLDSNIYRYVGTGSEGWKYLGTGYPSFAAYQQSSLQDANSQRADPLVNAAGSHAVGKPVSQYTLQTGSPAIDNGEDVGGMGPRDFYGNSIPRGKTYDIGAHESAYVGTPKVATTDDNSIGTGSNQFTYAGTWGATTGAGDGRYAGTSHWSSTAGSTSTYTFNGRRVELFGLTGTAAGILAVSMDGGSETLIDSYSAAGGSVTDTWGWASPPLASGTHTLTVRVTGTRHPNSSAAWVNIDRVDVARTIATVDDNLLGSKTNQFSYAGTWGATTAASDGRYAGTSHWSNTAGSTVTVPFIGTRIQLFGLKGTAAGIMGVTLDGGAEITVDNYNASAGSLTNTYGWASPTLPYGSHTLKVRVTGTRHPSSANTWIDLDRVEVIQ